MSETTDREGEAGFVGPGVIGEVAARVGSNLSLSPYCLLPECYAAIGASLGKAARLQTPVWPGLLNPALHIALSDADGRLSQALDFILQPLRDLQSERFANETESTRLWIKKRIKRLEIVHEQWTTDLVDDPRPESRPAQIAALRRRLKPLMLVENPAPGQLVKAMSNSADGALLATYDDDSLSGLLDAATTKAVNDFRLLEHGWQGRTFEIPKLKGPYTWPIVEPSISCLIVCHPDTLGRLLSSKEPVVVQFCRQLVTLSTCEGSRQRAIDSGQSVELFDRWKESIRDLVHRRRAGADYLVELSSNAEDLAMKHWRQVRQASASSSQRSRLGLNVPVLAARFALCSRLAFHEASVESRAENGLRVIARKEEHMRFLVHGHAPILVRQKLPIARVASLACGCTRRTTCMW